MAEDPPDIEEYQEHEKEIVTMHEKRHSPVSHNSDPGIAAQNPSWRRGIDEKQEKRILRKLDIHLLPFISLLYLLSFL
jgi:hypothetical protein